MNRFKVLIIIVIILFATGCSDYFMICSLNPFYLDKDVVLLHEIEGKWAANPVLTKHKPDNKDNPTVWKQADTTSFWKIERYMSKETVKTKRGKDSTVYKPMNGYLVKLINSQTDSAIYEFQMVLFRVNNALYADFMPEGHTGLENSQFATERYLKVHTLARVAVRKKQLVVSWLGPDCVRDMIENKHVRLNFKWVASSSRLLLTGKSEQLTAMIDRYASESRFIDWENQSAMLTLNRIKK